VSNGEVESKFLILKSKYLGISAMYTYVNGKLSSIEKFYHSLDMTSMPHEISVRELLNTYKTMLPEYRLAVNTNINYKDGISVDTIFPSEDDERWGRKTKQFNIETTWDPSNDEEGRFNYYYQFGQDGVLSEIYYQNSIDPLTKTVFWRSTTHIQGADNKLINSTANKYQIPKLQKIPKVNVDTSFDVTNPAAYMGDYEINGFPYAPIQGMSLVPFKYEIRRTIYIKDHIVIVTYYDDGSIAQIQLNNTFFRDPGVPSSNDPDSRSGILVRVN